MNLDSLFHELRQLHFPKELPLLRLKWNSRLSSSSGRFFAGTRLREPHIEIASYLRSLSDGQMHIRDTLLHEMIHYYLWWQGKPFGHTPEFHAHLKRTGAKRFNPVPKERPIKYWYACPGCKKDYPARRALTGDMACLSCCKKYNRGQFDSRFRLRPVSGPQATKPIPQEPKEESAFLAPTELASRLQWLQELIGQGKTPR